MSGSGRPRHVLVIGVGNPLRGDDGVGDWLVRELERSLEGAPTTLQLETVPLELFLLWTEESRVLILDAVVSGAAPGTVHRFDARQGPLPVRVFRASTHGLGVAQAVGLARALGRVPAELQVWGVEGAAFEAGQGLSPAVEAAARGLLDEVTEWARRAGAPPPA